MVGKDPTFNLTALANRLASEQSLMPLVGKIRRMSDFHSLHSDLMMANESIKALIEMLKLPTDVNDSHRLITESALLNNAIILYSRATKTRSDERGDYDLSARFSDDEKKSHAELVDLRDKAIAHFGSGGSYKGEWNAELAILQFRGEDCKPAVVGRRQTVDRLLVARAAIQIESAREKMRALFKEQSNAVTDEINKCVADDPNFAAEVGRHPLNLEIFMMSADVADAARASFDQGYASGGLSH